MIHRNARAGKPGIFLCLHEKGLRGFCLLSGGLPHFIETVLRTTIDDPASVPQGSQKEKSPCKGFPQRMLKARLQAEYLKQSFKQNGEIYYQGVSTTIPGFTSISQPGPK